MKRVFPDVWETDIESPFPGLTTHAYLLTRNDGNVLFYNTSHRHEIEAMAELGGVAYQFLSHQDELGDSLVWIHERFGTRLGGHVRERTEFARYRAPDILFDEYETLLGNIEVIPVPGHTPGSTCFLVDSPTGQRYLFTGDTIYRNGDGRWKAGFIAGYSEREPLAASLEALRRLEPDVVFSSAFAGNAGFEVMPRGGWAERVRHALEELNAAR